MPAGRPPLPLETWGRISRKRLNGVPTAVASVRDSDGKTRRVQRSGKTLADAERRLLEVLRDRLTPTYEVITRDSRLDELADKWLEDLAREQKAIATERKYRTAVDRFVRPIGQVRLAELTVPRVQRLVNRVADDNGPSQARILLVVLSGIVSLGVRYGAIPTNLVASVKAPAAANATVRAPTALEVQELRAALARHDQREARSDSVRDLADVGDMLLGTGARIGEVLALRWDDIDFAERAVSITATVVRGDDGLMRQETPKSASSNRRLKLPDFTLHMLERRRQTAEHEWIFPSPEGAPQWPENIRRRWSEAVAGTSVEWTTTKSCRKAVGTLLGAAGGKDQLGHHDESVTRKHYVQQSIDRPDQSDTIQQLGR